MFICYLSSGSIRLEATVHSSCCLYRHIFWHFYCPPYLPKAMRLIAFNEWRWCDRALFMVPQGITLLGMVITLFPRSQKLQHHEIFWGFLWLEFQSFSEDEIHATNGTFIATGGVLVGGKSYGPNSQWGVSRQQGLQFGGDVDLARTQVRTPVRRHRFSIFFFTWQVIVNRLCFTQHPCFMQQWAVNSFFRWSSTNKNIFLKYQNPSNMIAFGGPQGPPPPSQQGGTLVRLFPSLIPRLDRCQSGYARKLS